MPLVRVLLNEIAIFVGETRIESAVTGEAVNTRGENGFVAIVANNSGPTPHAVVVSRGCEV